MLHAERVHGWMPRRNVQSTGVHFRDVGQQRGGHDAVTGGNGAEVAKQDSVGEMGQRVALHRSTSTGAVGRRKRGAAFARAGALARPRRSPVAVGSHCYASVSHSKTVCWATQGSGSSCSLISKFA